jgi:hypothetical protein
LEAKLPPDVHPEVILITGILTPAKRWDAVLIYGIRSSTCSQHRAPLEKQQSVKLRDVQALDERPETYLAANV